MKHLFKLVRLLLLTAITVLLAWTCLCLRDLAVEVGRLNAFIHKYAGGLFP